jgi:thiol:disulfide interchange protein
MRRIVRLVLVVAVVALGIVVAYRYHSAPAPAPAPVVQAPAPPPSAEEQAAPSLHAHIYNEDANAKQDIAGALALAQAANKNVLLDFGANWCPDCQVLDIYMHDDTNSPLVDKNYVVVHVDVGRMDKNLDVAFTFNVPINKGIPALAVVQPSGRVVYSQTHGEFNNMRAMQSSSLTEFLKMWKPDRPKN